MIAQFLKFGTEEDGRRTLQLYILSTVLLMLNVTLNFRKVIWSINNAADKIYFNERVGEICVSTKPDFCSLNIYKNYYPE